MTKALTIYQPWASLVVIGAKTMEFRTWPIARARIGEPIVIHAASATKRRVDPGVLHAITEDVKAGRLAGINPTRAAIDLLEGMLRVPASIVYGCGIGVATFGEPRMDGTAWAWPVTSFRKWDAPMPCRGSQTLWDWPGSIAAR